MGGHKAGKTGGEKIEGASAEIGLSCSSSSRARVGIATALRAGRSGDRIPVGERFSALVPSSLGYHPASYTMGTGSFRGVKRQGRGIDRG